MVLAIGLNSGTSCDAVDAALIDIQGSGCQTTVKLIKYIEVPLPSNLRSDLIALGSDGSTTASNLARISVQLSSLFSAAALRVIEEAEAEEQEIGSVERDAQGNPPETERESQPNKRSKQHQHQTYKMEDVAFIGSHGQTVAHNPAETFTLQIGCPSVIAQTTGCWTVADFRSADVALGGEGAPLLPYVDYVLHRSAEEGRILLNVGGIANITVLPKDCMLKEMIAFDTGPGNMLMDLASAHFSNNTLHCDVNGSLAAAGAVDQAMLTTLLAHPFLKENPPKSTGRDAFGRAYFDSLLSQFEHLEAKDFMATLNAFTAKSVCDAVHPFVQKHTIGVMFVSGGGAHNPVLMANLTRYMGGACRVVSYDDVGFSSDAREAVAFAVLANETLHGNTSNVPSVTGASRQAVLGAIYPGKTRKDLSSLFS
eukprot:m.10096 g.10096  ORF g.10096 m.10096 type:complete len:425 (-) comp5922_c0_seq1:404-1678(-)